ncbi:hypothetical protein [Rhizobium leguminosarum]
MRGRYRRSARSGMSRDIEPLTGQPASPNSGMSHCRSVNDHSSLFKRVVEGDAFAAVKFIEAMGISQNFGTFICKILIKGLPHHPAAVPVENLRDAIECLNCPRGQSQRDVRFFVIRHDIIPLLQWNAFNGQKYSGRSPNFL